jgi:hypothetical protein
MAKWLITIGIISIVLGLAWPLIAKLGLGHLPGDIHIERKGFVFHFPLTTCLLISAVLTVLVWIFRR